jgi:hypothetical protein
MQIEIDEETLDNLVVCALREDARTQVGLLLEDGTQMARDVACFVRTLDAINVVLKYYGGDVVEIPDVLSLKRRAA